MSQGQSKPLCDLYTIHIKLKPFIYLNGPLEKFSQNLLRLYAYKQVSMWYWKVFLWNLLPSFYKDEIHVKYIYICKSKCVASYLDFAFLYTWAYFHEYFLNKACSLQIENLLSTNINGMTTRFLITENNYERNQFSTNWNIPLNYFLCIVR